jgi:hypothetical protein
MTAIARRNTDTAEENNLQTQELFETRMAGLLGIKSRSDSGKRIPTKSDEAAIVPINNAANDEHFCSGYRDRSDLPVLPPYRGGILL